MAYILDADWIIQTLKGDVAAKNTIRQLAGGASHVSWVTVGEIYEVGFNSPNPEAFLDSLREFLVPHRIVGLDEPVIARFAEIRAFLRRRGELISDFDILLAATALDRDLTVLTFNLRHFERIPDLRIYRLS
jgi:predicted nucleic acid-binding protein